MLKKLKQFINYSIISSVLFAILGILITIFPKTSISLFSYFIASTGIILGIYLIILDIISKDKIISICTATEGILLFIFGLILIIYPNTLSIFIPLILGIWFIISGVNKMKISLFIKEVDNRSFIITLIAAILSIICGFIFIFNPLVSTSVITTISGITIFLFALSNMIDVIIFKRNIKKVINEMKKRTAIIFED